MCRGLEFGVPKISKKQREWLLHQVGTGCEVPPVGAGGNFRTRLGPDLVSQHCGVSPFYLAVRLEEPRAWKHRVIQRMPHRHYSPEGRAGRGGVYRTP